MALLRSCVAALVLALAAVGKVEGRMGCPNYPCALKTVDELKVDAYTGRWFQVYANPVVALTFELGGFCATADYAALPRGNGVSLVNSQNQGSPDGPISDISGTAVVKNASEPGKLEVTFDEVPFPGSYWVIKLGPVEKGQYQYSVVTDDRALTLFILARNVEEFQSKYETEVLDFVRPKFQGKLRKPIATTQGEECAYTDAPGRAAAPSRRLRPATWA